MVMLGHKNPVHLIHSVPSGRRKHPRLDTRQIGRRFPKDGKTQSAGQVEENDEEDSSHRRFQAAMCYLRGICYAKQNALDRAKDCYKDAVRIDVQCYDAFNQLMKNSLMSPTEEWEFLVSLNFDSIVTGDSSSSQQAAELTKMLYTTRLSKYNNPDEFNTAVETLSTHYSLGSNPDLLLARAELLFTKSRFREALSLTESVLENDHYNFACLPLHLACLYELNEKNALFLLAHDFADHHPEEPATWLAVGVYYLTINKIVEARRFFSKASMMDPHFGPAWIGFAHTFAMEGEHDQAISAYSTAARLFQGTHLPQLFLGMQYLQLQNMTLAHEYFNAAYHLCQTDPLLLNELGVIFYHQDHLEEAVSVFTTSLTIAEETDSNPMAWLPTRVNLGHAYRRMERLTEALAEFDIVLRSGGRDAGVFCAKGMVLMDMGKPWEAIIALHEALAVSPQDPIANDLLIKALEESAATGNGMIYIQNGPNGLAMNDEDIDSFVESRKVNASNRATGIGHRKRKGKELAVQDGDGMDIVE